VKVLKENGYEVEGVETHPHEEKADRFQRSKPNELWQTDIFTFTLKRQNRRVYLVAFMDDYSRFIVGYGLYASMVTSFVLEVLLAATGSYGSPQEILTDNGPQYVTWRGKSKFTRELEKKGIKQIVAHPRRPQTLGKVERFWGTLWRNCVEAAVFHDLEDARKRIGLFMDDYNFRRPHQGLEGLTPADLYFKAAEEVKKTLQARVAANALELARNGIPLKPFYMTGNVGGQGFSVHAEGERVFITRADGSRQEVTRREAEAATGEKLPSAVCPVGADVPALPEETEESEAAPGTSPLDGALANLSEKDGKEAAHVAQQS
jgi:hypothetical protein